MMQHVVQLQVNEEEFIQHPSKAFIAARSVSLVLASSMLVEGRYP